jgi:hypothetical protein
MIDFHCLEEQTRNQDSLTPKDIFRTRLSHASEAVRAEMRMSLRGNCPVCGKGPIRPTFKEFAINVALRNQPQHPIGGLRGYQCDKELHIFFVMAKDVEMGDVQSSELTEEKVM